MPPLHKPSMATSISEFISPVSVPLCAQHRLLHGARRGRRRKPLHACADVARCWVPSGDGSPANACERTSTASMRRLFDGSAEDAVGCFLRGWLESSALTLTATTNGCVFYPL